MNLMAMDVLAVSRAITARWEVLDPAPFGPTGLMFVGPDTSIVITQAPSDDGNEWIHVSLAHPQHDPSYRELVDLHRIVFGRKRFAYQVFAPESEHVNIHEHALHLWGRADGQPGLPNFGINGTI